MPSFSACLEQFRFENQGFMPTATCQVGRALAKSLNLSFAGVHIPTFIVRVFTS